MDAILGRHSVSFGAGLSGFLLRCVMKTIPLTQGKFAIVDDSDFEWLNQWKWYVQKSKNISVWYNGHWTLILNLNLSTGRILRLMAIL
jgi:hypothetical protein